MPPKKRAAPKKKAEPKKNIVADPKTGECPICFENFDNDYAELKCKHYYCYNCISNWSEKENTCPVCKGRFSYLHRIQKNAETNEFSKTKITVKKKSQADAIYQARRHSGAAIPPYRLLSILSYSTLNMLQYNSLHHYDEDDDEDEDYFPNPDLSHDMDEEEEMDDFEWIRNVSRRINDDDEEEEDVNIFSHFHSLLGDLMPERRGTSENPISLIDEEVEGEDSNHMSGGSSSSGYRSSSNSSSNAQPIVIDLTDDQVQSDIRDISYEDGPADAPVPSSSSSSSTIIPSEQAENQKTVGSKRRRRFIPEHEVAAEEVEGGYVARRNRSSSGRRVEVSSDDIIEEIEL